MALMGKENPEDICEHLEEVIQTMIDNDIKMSHDFEGSFLYCPQCDKSISLEAYGSRFNNEDIGE